MKNMKTIGIGMLIAFILCACGSKTFRCEWCMKQVKQVPREVTVLGQTVDVCDSCYKYVG